MFAEYGSLLKNNRNYRLLWFGYLISQFGDWFNLIASAAVIANITKDGTSLSYLFLARFLPLFFFSPFAGLLADKFDRRYLMVVSDILRALTVLGFIFVREPSQVWIFYTLTVAQFILSALFVPARSAVVANVVREKDLIVANALDSVTWSSTLAIGAMVGGLATAVLGTNSAFILDALTYFASAWLIYLVQLPALTPKENPAGTWSQSLEFIEGLKFLWLKPALLGLTLVKAGGALIWGGINVLEVNYASQIFPIIFTLPGYEKPIGADGSVTLAIIYTLSGIGTGVGPIVLRRIFGDIPEKMLWGITLSFLFLSFGIWGLSRSTTIGVFSFFTILRTLGSGGLWVFSAALLQIFVPDYVRGRVFALEFALLTLMQSLSIYWAGFAQDIWHLSVPAVTFSLSVVGFAVTALWLPVHWYAHHRPESWQIS